MNLFAFHCKLWIKGNLFSSYLTPTTCHVSNMISFSLYNRQTHIHMQKVKPDTGLKSITIVSLPLENNKTLTHGGFMRHVKLHPDRGNKSAPRAALETLFLALCCYFSQPTSKVRTPKAHVV